MGKRYNFMFFSPSLNQAQWMSDFRSAMLLELFCNPDFAQIMQKLPKTVHKRIAGGIDSAQNFRNLMFWALLLLLLFSFHTCSASNMGFQLRTPCTIHLQSNHHVHIFKDKVILWIFQKFWSPHVKNQMENFWWLYETDAKLKQEVASNHSKILTQCPPWQFSESLAIINIHRKIL